MRSLQYIIFFLFFPVSLHATHVKSTQMYYTYIGSGVYDFTVHAYTECNTNAESVVPSLKVYDQDGVQFGSTTFLSYSDTAFFTIKKEDNCLDSVLFEECFKKVTFNFQLRGLDETGSYEVVLRECNRELVNNISPSVSSYCVINKTFVSARDNQGNLNSCPLIDNVPNPFICVGEEFKLNLKTIDPDGDSLVYSLCEVFVGKDDIASYNQGYSATAPLGDQNTFTIDSESGIITAFTTEAGAYIVGVCIDEYRNGQWINTVKQDLKFITLPDCPEFSAGMPIGGINYGMHCGSSVRFENFSNGGNKYYWDFGVDSLTSDVSTDFQPTFQYPESGIYEVTFIVKDSVYNCSDTFIGDIEIRTPNTSFLEDITCLSRPVKFTNNSTTSDGGDVSLIEYYFGDGDYEQTSNVNEVIQHKYLDGGNWTVTMVAHDPNGCGTDTLRKVIVIPSTAIAEFSLSPEKVALPGELVTIINESKNYDRLEWNFGDGYSYDGELTKLPSEVPSGDHVFTLVAYDVNDPSCNDFDTVIYSISNSALDIPTSFTPNNDGINDVLSFIAIDVANFHFVIYDRWGEKMYETTDINATGWDGTYKGKVMPTGAYAFQASAINEDTGEALETKKGTILLIR